MQDLCAKDQQGKTYQFERVDYFGDQGFEKENVLFTKIKPD